jgi:tRNA threonylcarbamoyladenosine biosynthesis protein TsaE
MERPVLQKLLANEASTIAFGGSLAPYLRKGDIVKFTGGLGVGKTTLTRGILSGLGGNPEEVHSPTFSLVHHYFTPRCEIIHCDFYRLPNGAGLEEFGGLEFFESESIFLIEWSERIKLFKSTIPNRLLGIDLRANAEGREARLFGPWDIVD